MKLMYPHQFKIEFEEKSIHLNGERLFDRFILILKLNRPAMKLP